MNCMRCGKEFEGDRALCSACSDEVYGRRSETRAEFGTSHAEGEEQQEHASQAGAPARRAGLPLSAAIGIGLVFMVLLGIGVSLLALLFNSRSVPNEEQIHVVRVPYDPSTDLPTVIPADPPTDPDITPTAAPLAEFTAAVNGTELPLRVQHATFDSFERVLHVTFIAALADEDGQLLPQDQPLVELALQLRTDTTSCTRDDLRNYTVTFHRGTGQAAFPIRGPHQKVEFARATFGGVGDQIVGFSCDLEESPRLALIAQGTGNDRYQNVFTWSLGFASELEQAIN